MIPIGIVEPLLAAPVLLAALAALAALVLLLAALVLLAELVLLLAELHAVAVTSTTAAAAPMKYPLLRMSFPNFVAPGTGHRPEGEPAGAGRS
jgi:hypothetical protein